MFHIFHTTVLRRCFSKHFHNFTPSSLYKHHTCKEFQCHHLYPSTEFQLESESENEDDKEYDYEIDHNCSAEAENFSDNDSSDDSNV